MICIWVANQVELSESKDFILFVFISFDPLIFWIQHCSSSFFISLPAEAVLANQTHQSLSSLSGYLLSLSQKKNLEHFNSVVGVENQVFSRLILSIFSFLICSFSTFFLAKTGKQIKQSPLILRSTSFFTLSHSLSHTLIVLMI